MVFVSFFCLIFYLIFWLIILVLVIRFLYKISKNAKNFINEQNIYKIKKN